MQTSERKASIAYIRPLHEYNSNTQNPNQKYVIKIIEDDQRQFTELITSISHLTYHERLRILDLDALELRRLLVDLIQHYEVLENLMPLELAVQESMNI